MNTISNLTEKHTPSTRYEVHEVGSLPRLIQVNQQQRMTATWGFIHTIFMIIIAGTNQPTWQNLSYITNEPNTVPLIEATTATSNGTLSKLAGLLIGGLLYANMHQPASCSYSYQPVHVSINLALQLTLEESKHTEPLPMSHHEFLAGCRVLAIPYVHHNFVCTVCLFGGIRRAAQLLLQLAPTGTLLIFYMTTQQPPLSPLIMDLAELILARPPPPLLTSSLRSCSGWLCKSFRVLSTSFMVGRCSGVMAQQVSTRVRSEDGH